MPEITSLYDLDRPGLAELMARLDQPSYRADQVWQWLYRQLAPSVDGMTNLPLGLRAALAQHARLHTIEPITQTPSDDGMATKFLFRLGDGRLVETVLMHYVDPADGDVADAEADTFTDTSAGAVPRGRHTVCLSTQAGCAMGCVFCATGQMGLERDLSMGECVEQVVHCARALSRAGERLSNVVFMGMGEPLANWAATWGTVGVLTDPDGLGLSPRRLTISTVGVVPGIRRLARADKPVRLALSVHAPDDGLRNQLVPINRTYPLEDVLEACRQYQASGGRRLTVEYVLIREINDSPAQARRLAARLAGLSVHVNLIPLNPTAGSPMQPSRRRDVLAFERALRRAGLPVTSRMRRGIEIDAGCGQLRSRAVEGRIGRSIDAADAPA